MLMKYKYFLFVAGIAAGFAGNPASAQVTPQLSVEQLTRELTCAGGTVSNGQCVTPGESPTPAAPAAAAADPNSLQGQCEADGNHVWDAATQDCQEKRGGTLGFNLGQRADQPAPAKAAAAPLTRAPSATRVSVQRDLAANLLLTFEFNSANLTEQAIANARVFAQAMNSPALEKARFEIQGHTDMAGTREYNQDLSQRRADAVKEFLISQGVSAERLTARGYAFDQLADPQQPMAPENRRVVARRVQ